MEKETTENQKSEKKVNNDSFNQINKELKFVTFLLLIGVAWIKWLRYVVIWVGVALGTWWIILPVFFFWTSDYWYLKMFGTIPMVGIACIFLLYGIAETFNYSSVKTKSKIKDAKDTVDELSNTLKNHETVVKSTMEKTLALMAASQNFINYHNNKYGKQDNITAEPKS